MISLFSWGSPPVLQIERTINIAAPLSAVFTFCADIRNHGRIAPPQTREQLLDPGDIPLQVGSVVKFRARYGGLYWTLSSRITAFEPPEAPGMSDACFRDEQVRGPFSFWKHDHLFSALPNGETCVTDRFQFAAPLGPLGRIAERLWLKREMRALMVHLQDTAKRIIETEHAAVMSAGKGAPDPEIEASKAIPKDTPKEDDR
jgi:ligand-binding SRPBCC domain-containing protein